MANTNNIITKVSLPKIAEAVVRTLDAYEEGIFDDEALSEILGDLNRDLAVSVDRRISFLDFLGNEATSTKAGSGVIGKAQDLSKAYKEKMELAKRLKERVESSTLSLIDAAGAVKFEGTLGKLAAQVNPPRLIVDLDLGSKSLSNLIDPAKTDVLSIPSQYVKQVTVLQLDTEAIKRDLEAGQTLDWARLERGKHLRIRR